MTPPHISSFVRGSLGFKILLGAAFLNLSHTPFCAELSYFPSLCTAPPCWSQASQAKKISDAMATASLLETEM